MKEQKQYDLAIGIDPGTNTGIAIWDIREKKFVDIKTMMIHQAWMLLLSLLDENDVFVRIEDPTKRTWFGHEDKFGEKKMGAGSIRRDFSIWKDIFTDHKIDFEVLHPKNIVTKTTAEYFKGLTKWEGRTSNHARDAAMMVFQYK